MSEPLRPFDPGALTEDLRSDDPQRVASALSTLRRAWLVHPSIAVPMPPPDCLDAFGDAVPEEMLDLYVSVLTHYRGLVDSPEEPRRHALVEAVVRYGRGEGTCEVALDLKGDAFPDYAAEDALAYLWGRGLHKPGEILAAHALVDYLLDSDKTRAATVAALRKWTLFDSFPEIRAAVRPRLDPAEIAVLDAAEEE